MEINEQIVEQIILYFAILATFLLGGCFPKVRLFISAVSLPLYCICILMAILGDVEHNYECHGKPFVWLQLIRRLNLELLIAFFVICWDME